jgi:hypothetical protein
MTRLIEFFVTGRDYTLEYTRAHVFITDAS